MGNVDYFKGLSKEEIYSGNIEVEEKIHDTIPKYYKFGVSPSDSEAFRHNMNGTMKEMVLKDKFNDIGMFCFVSWDWIEPLSEWIGTRKCLEVMSGRGWLSKGLRSCDVDVIATDDFSWHKLERFVKWNDLVTEVEDLDAVESVVKYGKDIDILIMAWAYMDDTAYRVIKKLHEVNPQAVVIFCGEGSNGCTADDSFFEHFEELDDELFYEHVASEYKTWYGLNDCLTLGRYSPSDKQEG